MVSIKIYIKRINMQYFDYQMRSALIPSYFRLLLGPHLSDMTKSLFFISKKSSKVILLSMTNLVMTFENPAIKTLYRR